MKYYKLVRDRIPGIIKADGKICVYETLADEDCIVLLDQKMSEELAEYQESKSMEELADLLEVMQAVVKARGWTMEELERVRAEKAAKRGGFERKILLKEVKEDYWMDIERAKELLSALADGVDPFTGEILPRNHVCNQPEMIRAFHEVMNALPPTKKKSLPCNAGKPWTEIEEEKLLDEFDSGMKISAIAKEHGRSKGAIESRLADLGKITDTYFGRKPR